MGGGRRHCSVLVARENRGTGVNSLHPFLFHLSLVPSSFSLSIFVLFSVMSLLLHIFMPLSSSSPLALPSFPFHLSLLFLFAVPHSTPSPSPSLVSNFVFPLHPRFLSLSLGLSIFIPDYFISLLCLSLLQLRLMYLWQRKCRSDSEGGRKWNFFRIF